MTAALKKNVLPALRNMGFTGTFPHLRRIADHVDLMTFQFDRNGGGFVMEAARGELSGFTTHWGKFIPANKLTAWDLHPDQRIRIQPKQGGGTDSWFRYDAENNLDQIARNALEEIVKFDWNFGGTPPEKKTTSKDGGTR